MPPGTGPLPDQALVGARPVALSAAPRYNHVMGLHPAIAAYRGAPPMVSYAASTGRPHTGPPAAARRTDDSVQISHEGAARLAAEATDNEAATRQQTPPTPATEAPDTGTGREAGVQPATADPDADAETTPSDPSARDPAGRPLSPPEVRQLRQLQRRDAEVRAHEQAHVSAAGSHARGGAQLSFQRGPDGRSYAVGGEVSIDTGAERDPHRTQAKMRQVRRAALAPAEPSAQDRRIAARAATRGNAAAMDIRALGQAERAIERAERSGDERVAALARQEIQRRGGEPPPETNSPEAAAGQAANTAQPGRRALRVDVSA